jgi:hypothetical protein
MLGFLTTVLGLLAAVAGPSLIEALAALPPRT